MGKSIIKFNYKIKWHHRLLISAVFITTLPALIIGLSSVNRTEEELTQSVNNQLSNIANNASNEINSFFVSSLDDQYLIKNTLEDNFLGIKEKISLVSSEVSEMDEILAMSIFFKNDYGFSSGMEVHESRIDSLIKSGSLELSDFLRNQDKILQKILNKNNIFGKPIFIKSLNHWCIFSVIKLSIKDAPEAYLSTILDLSILNNKLSAPEYSRVGKILIVNRAGESIFAISDSLIDKKIINESTNVLKGSSRITVVNNYLVEGKKYVVSTAFPENINWAVIAIQDYNRAYFLVNDIKGTIYLWILIGIIVTIIIGLIVSETIRKPISYIATQAKRIASGDFDIKIDYHVNDSIGELSTAMRNMSSSLKENFLKIEKQNKELEEYSKNLEKKVLDRTKKLKETNEDLQKAYLKVLELNNEKNEFLGIAAHDLKNPLGAIKGFGSIILGDKSLSQEDLDEFASIIVESSERMFDIITSLLDINKIEEGRLTINYSQISANELCKALIRENSELASKKSIIINTTYLENDLFFSTDKTSVLQILDNFLSNAIKFSQFENAVDVTLREEEKSVVFSVKDYGPGLSDDDKSKLFTKFSKLSARPTGGENSTGLGLSIAKKITEMLGGEIIVNSELGKGAEFILVLPK